MIVVFNVPFKALDCVGKTSYLLQTPCTLQLFVPVQTNNWYVQNFVSTAKAERNTFIGNLLAQFCSFFQTREQKIPYTAAFSSIQLPATSKKMG